MADLLATPDDLAAVLQVPAGSIDTAAATVALEAATALVQAIIGQRLVEVVNDAVTLYLDDLDDSCWLPLPELPVTAVSSAAIGATPVTDWSAVLPQGRLYRALGWRSLSATTAYAPAAATVVYTHGSPVGDQRLQLARAVVLSLAKGGYANPTGVLSAKIDDYSVAYEKAAGASEISPHMRDALRRQYGRPGRSARLAARGC
ncbi:hypothetical protein [Actinoplanes sp. N902-109]|uniref:hypothetical protein n=1 Tax=Actinoplanes sp. (strain N902-109) TaxID=649831 RepID=UPI000329472C|nr:hypothetical protein [Actinoplanes sp. N902-109]AGL13875.1 hypothetical protein L083_0365 [Actinoplanes sp. N902-109]